MSDSHKYRGIIYKYTFPNGKVYIGQTIHPRSRKSQHLCESTGARHVAFWRAYKKYGSVDYEEIEQVEESSKEALCERLNTLEQFYIAAYNSTNPKYGYNLTSGGSVFVVNEEGRKHMSEARTDKLPVLQYDLDGNFIKEFESTTAAGKALGAHPTNIWSCCIGYRTGKRKKKVQIVKGYTFRFKKDYPDVPLRIDLNITDLNKKRVLQFSKDGTFIQEWDSVLDAERGTGTRESGIRQCCYGKYRQSNGFMWRFRDDYDEVPNQIDPVRPKVKRPFTNLTIEQREKGIIKAREVTSKKVCQFSKDGVYLAEYVSLQEAASLFGGKSATISNACKYKTSKTAYGYQWRYKEDVDNPFKGISPFKNASQGPKKPIMQYSLDGKFIKEWDCIKAAADYYHVTKGCLSMALSKQRKTLGFIWKYKK